MPAGETIKNSLNILVNALETFPGDDRALGQLAWMLFLKILDDQEPADEATRDGHRLTLLPDALRWRSWAAPGGRTGGELISFVNDTLLPGLKGLVSPLSLAGTVRDVFGGASNFVKRGDLLRQVVDQLNQIDFSRSDSLSEASEAFADLPGRPREPSRKLVDFMVERVDPRSGDTILDPSCGTGGFLVGVCEHLRRKAHETNAEGPPLKSRFTGIEDRWLHHLLCVTDPRLYLLVREADIFADVRRGDALQWGIGRRDPVDVITTIPTFRQFMDPRVSEAFPAAFRTPKAETLLVYLTITLLRPGGRAAILVSDEFLGTNGVETKVKEKLLDECDLHTIIRIPEDVFNAGHWTNLLFLTKGEPTKGIWYYQHALGEDLEPERQWWDDRRETSDAWRLSIREVRARDFNLNLHRIAAGAVSAPSRLLSLSLQGLRGFTSLNLSLPPQGPAVIIGANGAGKSTVLEGIAMILSAFTSRMVVGPFGRSSGVSIAEDDIKTGHQVTTVSATLRVREREETWEISARRTRGTFDQSSEIAQRAEALGEQLLRFENASLPVLCFYSALRGLGDDGGRRASPSFMFPQLEAYHDALHPGLGPFRDFIRWYRLEEGLENQERLRKDPSYRNPRLQIVRRALQGFLGELGAARFSNMRIERSGEEKEGALVVEKDGMPLRIEQFSEGEKNTLLLVADLARRFAVANPALEDPLQGEGIVLIDEVDLHLHPAWQRELLPALAATFPSCQIIASTHSPQVLSRIPKESVFILEDFKLVRVTPHTMGRDSNSILGEVFGVPERPTYMEEKIHNAAVLIDEDRYDEARQAIDDLVSDLGEHDGELVRLRTMLSFLQRPVRD